MDGFLVWLLVCFSHRHQIGHDINLFLFRLKLQIAAYVHVEILCLGEDLWHGFSAGRGMEFEFKRAEHELENITNYSSPGQPSTDRRPHLTE